MVVVAEQHDIDWSDGIRIECRALTFPQYVQLRWVFGARRIERRIRDETQSSNFQYDGRTADVDEVELPLDHR